MQMLTLKSPVGIRVEDPNWQRQEDANARQREQNEVWLKEHPEQPVRTFNNPYDRFCVIESVYLVVEPFGRNEDDKQHRQFKVILAAGKSGGYGNPRSPLMDAGGCKITIDSASIKSVQELPKTS